MYLPRRVVSLSSVMSIGDDNDPPSFLAPRETTTTEASSPLQDDDYSMQLLATIWFLTAMSALFMSLRIYAKVWRKRPLWWDDWVLIAGWVS